MNRTGKIAVLGMALLLVLSLNSVWSGGSQETAEKGKTIAVVTPYMANATTAAVIQYFEGEAESRGWTVRVSDTAGDFGMLVSRIQDAVSQNVDAIVLGMGDPAQMTAGLVKAEEAGIPVFGLDAGFIDGVYLNITSDNADLGHLAAKALADSIGGSGNVVLFTHDPHPGVRARAVGARETLAEYPDIKIVREVHIEVPGPVDFARGVTSDILTSMPKGELAGIWAGWDEPAYGATQAINRVGRDELRVVGVDGTDFARQEIDGGDVFVATIIQDFEGMAARLAELMDAYFNGDAPESKVYLIPGKVYSD